MKKKFFSNLIILITMMALASHTPVFAKKLVFEDDFSSGTFTKWLTTREHADYWSINHLGEAQATINRGSTIVELVPSDDNWQSQWKNIEWDFDMITIDGLDKNFSFNYQDVANWYEVHFMNSQFQLAKVKDGHVLWSVFRPFSANNHQTYHMRLILRGAAIKLFIDDKLVADELDPTFDKNYGKIGIKATAGSIYPTILAFDNIRVYDLDQEDEAETADIQFKQNDAAWAEKEYDHAKKWSDQPTIKRWGCALTSMAMVLRHYQINKLPPMNQETPEEREIINPETLNRWLQSQIDGYLGEGFLNWIAITRLTRLINSLDQTVKLEYQNLKVADSTKPYVEAIDELKENRWTIADLPHHFVTVYGMNEAQNNLKIYDPFASIDWLSQYVQNNQAPRNYKKFVPSHTDLSYLLFAFNSDIEVKIFDKDNVDITDKFKYVEHISDSVEDGEEKSLNVIAIPKPASETYKIKLTAAQPLKTGLTIFAYNQTADLTNLSQSDLIVGITPLEFEINYQKESASSLTPIKTTLPQLSATVDQLAQDGQLPWSVNFWLQTYLDAAAKNQDEQLDSSYQSLLDKLTDWFKSDLNDLTYQYLKQEIAKSFS